MPRSDRHKAMDQACRSDRDREIWMKAEADTIERWQRKVAKLIPDALTARISIRAAVCATPDDDVSSLKRFNEALAAADRLVEFLKEHSGGRKLEEPWTPIEEDQLG